MGIAVSATMDLVAPHAGAWIETRRCLILGRSAHVAPHAGAWIETLIQEYHLQAKTVAPHAGAWIETHEIPKRMTLLTSPPMRGRGLKPLTTITNHS